MRNRHLTLEAHSLPTVTLYRAISLSAKLPVDRILLHTLDVVFDYSRHHPLWQSGLAIIRAVMIQYFSTNEFLWQFNALMVLGR